jgi:deoxycytidine triphosphate deaminase
MTNEVVGCKEKTMGIISQRSNLARLPVVVNFSALLDTGFVGRLSGAIINPNNFPIVLKPNIRILQIMFDSCIGINRKYAGRKSSKNLDQFGSDVPVYKVDKEWIKHD